MKRDMELIRQILIEFEKIDEQDRGGIGRFKIEGYSHEEVVNHVFLLEQKNMVEIINCTSNTGRAFLAKGLTWEGHDFLDKARNERIWKKALAKFSNIGVTATLDLLKELLTSLIKEELSM